MIQDIYSLKRSDEFFLGPGQETVINLVLEKALPFPCTKLYGQVVGDIKPISGATVKLCDTNFNPLCHTVTDCRGSFSLIDTLPPGDYQIVAVANGFQTSESSLISLKPHHISHITIRLSPDKNAALGTVYGVVRGETNRPLPKTQVYLFNANDMVYPVAVTTSNADGEYLIFGINPGNYAIAACRRGYILPEKICVSILSGEVSLADIYLYISAEALQGTISGKIVYQNKAVPNALTALYRIENNSCTLIQTRYSNSQGFYLFSNLPAGKYIVKAKLESDCMSVCKNSEPE